MGSYLLLPMVFLLNLYISSLIKHAVIFLHRHFLISTTYQGMDDVLPYFNYCDSSPI